MTLGLVIVACPRCKAKTPQHYHKNVWRCAWCGTVVPK
jgi:ribosomal protein L37AE/L43A